MISEALELHVEGGRVSHSWCMCVVRHGCGGLGGGRDVGGDLCACGTKPGSCSHVWRCLSIFRVRVEFTDYTRLHHHPGAQLWVGSSRNWSVFLERP